MNDRLRNSLKKKKEVLQRIEEISLSIVPIVGVEGQEEKVDRLVEQRASLWKLVNRLNERAETSVAEIKEAPLSVPLREEIDNLLSEIKHLNQSISEVDERISTKIQSVLNELEKDLKKVRKTKKNMGRFRSRWVPESGSELDKTV